MIKPKQLISFKSRPQPLPWIKKSTEKPHLFDLQCYLLRAHSKYSNRAITLIQQSCISNILIKQSPHSLCYKKTKQTSILKLKGSKDLSDKKLRNNFLVARANGITTQFCPCHDIKGVQHIGSYFVIPLAIATYLKLVSQLFIA